jgi:hypothetical protein
MTTTEDRISTRLADRKAMTRSLVVRVPDDLHEKLQELAEKVRAKTGRKTTLSDVARAVLEDATESKGVPPSTFLAFPKFNVEEARQMLEEGQSVQAIAMHFGMSASTLYRLRRQARF